MRTYQVKSSSQRGETYRVTIYDDGDVRCHCRGYKFRGYCRHQLEAMAMDRQRTDDDGAKITADRLAQRKAERAARGRSEWREEV